MGCGHLKGVHDARLLERVFINWAALLDDAFIEGLELFEVKKAWSPEEEDAWWADHKERRLAVIFQDLLGVPRARLIAEAFAHWAGPRYRGGQEEEEEDSETGSDGADSAYFGYDPWWAEDDFF